jgi:hypothetical protein
MKVGAWLGVTLWISLISSIYLPYISSKVGIYLLHTGQKWIWKPLPRPSWYESFEEDPLQAPKQYQNLMNSKDQGLLQMPNQHWMSLGWFGMLHALMTLWTRFETKLEIYKIQCQDAILIQFNVSKDKEVLWLCPSHDKQPSSSLLINSITSVMLDDDEVLLNFHSTIQGTEDHYISNMRSWDVNFIYTQGHPHKYAHIPTIKP